METKQQNLFDDYLAVQTWGTLEQTRVRREVVGDYDALLVMRFSGTPLEATDRAVRSSDEHIAP
jgi:hypothetical protein